MTSVFLPNLIKSIKWTNSAQKGESISPTSGWIYHEVQEWTDLS